MVVVQIWPFNLENPFSRKLKIKQLNYLISYTDKRKVFLERLNKSKDIFEKFSLREKLIITGREMIQKSKWSSEIQSLIPGNFFFIKTRPNFCGNFK